MTDHSLATWQTQWNQTTKALATKGFFFPIIKDRLNTKIKLTTNFTAITTAHVKTEAYLNRFKLTESQNALEKTESNSRPPNVCLRHTTKRERERERNSYAKVQNNLIGQ